MVGRAPAGASREDKLEALHAQLVQAVEELATSEGWRRMLDVAARFHTYSPSNILLIGMQRPDATRVAGIRTWNELGRRVHKGEHGIAILAPCVYREPPGEKRAATDLQRAVAEPEPELVPPTSSKPSPEPAGTSAAQTGADTRTRQVRGFKVVHVFDVSQTSGDPLPDVEPALLQGDGPEGLWDHLAGLVQSDRYELQRGPCGYQINGYTDFDARIVRIRDDVDPAQAVKTLAHELGHIRADHEHRFPDYAVSRNCRGQAEVEAESIAYLITAQAGLDTTGYSVPYVAGWAGRNTELLQVSMATVLRAARGLSAGLPETAPPHPKSLPDAQLRASTQAGLPFGPEHAARGRSGP